MPKTNTKEKILSYLSEFGETSPNSLVQFLGISSQALFRHLKTLLQNNQIEKIGSPPKVYYRISKQKSIISKTDVSKTDLKMLDKNFYFVSPIGESYGGIEAMEVWCERQKLPIQKTIEEYKKTFKKYDQYKKSELINGIEKMKSTFKDVYLDALFYFDFYAIERFGKTKLGYFLLYSKQGQSMRFMQKLIDEIKPKIQELIKKNDFDAIAFAPPTVKRDLQIMKLIEKECSFGLRIVKIEKIKTPIIVPQKTLSKLNDRIQNARNTMLVTEKHSFNKVLLVDDAVGSGSTLNEISKQMKEKGIAKYIVGLALTGSFKGFEVLNEV
jgi:DNA-binding transcriptional ArsR family regulator